LILHTVAFSLRHPEGSPAETHFLDDALVLARLPMVGNVRRFRQVSQKSPYRFGFSMEFADQAAYDAYNHHPSHVGFVRDRWLVEVSRFQETDYIAL
jgi:hypothetical protein